MLSSSSGRPFAPLRYLQWAHSTPSMIYMLALLADWTGIQVRGEREREREKDGKERKGEEGVNVRGGREDRWSQWGKGNGGVTYAGLES